MILSRRSLLTGFTALLAAPAIVRASSLMPVKAFAEEGFVPYMGPVQFDRVLWVAAGGSGDYYTLHGAMQDAKPGDTIMLTPGIFDSNGLRVNTLKAVF